MVQGWSREHFWSGAGQTGGFGLLRNLVGDPPQHFLQRVDPKSASQFLSSPTSFLGHMADTNINWYGFDLMSENVAEMRPGSCQFAAFRFTGLGWNNRYTAARS